MAEKLISPKGPWIKKTGYSNPWFEHDAGIDLESGVQTIWKKSLSPIAQIVTRVDTHLDTLRNRWVMDSTNALDRSILYTIKDDGENQYMQCGYVEDRFKSLNIVAAMKEAQMPASINVKQISAVYPLDGKLSSVRIQFGSDISQDDSEKPHRYTALFIPAPEKKEEYLFAVIPGHSENFIDESRGLLDAQKAQLGYANIYEDKRIGLLPSHGDLAILITSALNSDERLVAFIPQELNMDVLLPVIKTDSPALWMQALELAAIDIQKIPR